MINWLNLLIYVSVLSITPGPNNINCLYLAAKGGFGYIKKFFIGSMSMFMIKVFLCGYLNVLLATVLPTITVYLKWAGALYMIYLAWHMAKSGWEEDKENNSSFESSIKSGIILQLLNGKSWIAALSLYAVYVIPYTQKFIYVLLAMLLFALTAAIASLIWAGLGVAIKNLMAKYKKPFGIIMGLGLVYCAVTAVI